MVDRNIQQPLRRSSAACAAVGPSRYCAVASSRQPGLVKQGRGIRGCRGNVELSGILVADRAQALYCT
jgi:hypothetical protein